MLYFIRIFCSMLFISYAAQASATNTISEITKAVGSSTKNAVREVVTSIENTAQDILKAPNITLIEVKMYKVTSSGLNEALGTIKITQSGYGIVLSPDLKGLQPGVHGFHLHQNPSCEAQTKNGKAVAALAAGGHFDPANSGKHSTPWGDGHLGDLPALYVDSQGIANQPVLAPRLTLQDVPGHALMIHAGGDNHADAPAALGGGGARIACGIAR